MSEQWSQRFANELEVSLPPDVVDWLDGNIRDEVGSPHLGDFFEPFNPEKLLDMSFPTIWGGQLLPDTIPILGNGCGDVIALRFGRDGRVSELICWHHETGDWQPFGNTLAEAVLCDIALMKLQVDPTYFGKDENPPRYMENWAVDWVRRTTGPTLNWTDPIEGEKLSVFRTLLDAGICEAVARRELCRSYLISKLMEKCWGKGGAVLAERLGVQWPVVNEWLFDTALIPEKYHAPLSEVTNTPIERLVVQDWDQAAAEAQRVCQLRPDLGWPYAILGWAAERDHDPGKAVENYLAGLKTLGTSCCFMGTVGCDLAIRRLDELRDHVSSDSINDSYFQATQVDVGVPSRIRQYWLQKAEQAAARGEHDLAYQCYYNAGWDDYAANDMQQILEGLVKTAEGAGYLALSRIAKLHLASLRSFEKLLSESQENPPSRLRTFWTKLVGKR